jgi:NAD(P)-dependent dehydrogenase (short-subunit alcohol dehydrogenase family)
MELQPGIQVSIIEPGAIATPLGEINQAAENSKRRRRLTKALYGEWWFDSARRPNRTGDSAGSSGAECVMR